MKKLLITIPIIVLAGCGGANKHDDLSKWMKSQEISRSSFVRPIPKAREFTPLIFIAKADPFNERKVLKTEEEANNKNAPDPYRRKEPLEEYSTDQLAMVGLLDFKGDRFALIRTPNNVINYVKKGNYMGVNYGKILEITDDRIVLEERIYGGTDGWAINKAEVLLQD